MKQNSTSTNCSIEDLVRRVLNSGDQQVVECLRLNLLAYEDIISGKEKRGTSPRKYENSSPQLRGERKLLILSGNSERASQKVIPLTKDHVVRFLGKAYPDAKITLGCEEEYSNRGFQAWRTIRVNGLSCHGFGGSWRSWSDALTDLVQDIGKRKFETIEHIRNQQGAEGITS